MLGVTVPRVTSESPRKDRSRGVCFLAGRQPQTFCCSSIRLLVLQKRLFSVDQLVCVLPGLAGGGGDGRSSTLTAACSGTGWGRDSASLTETDRSTDSSVFWLRRFHAQFDVEGDVWSGVSVTGWCDSFIQFLLRMNQMNGNAPKLDMQLKWDKMSGRCRCGQERDGEWLDGEVTYPRPSPLPPCCCVPRRRQRTGRVSVCPRGGG